MTCRDDKSIGVKAMAGTYIVVEEVAATKSELVTGIKNDSGVVESKGANTQKSEMTLSTQVDVSMEEQLSRLASCAATVDLARSFKATIEQLRSAHEVSLGDSSSSSDSGDDDSDDDDSDDDGEK